MVREVKGRGMSLKSQVISSVCWKLLERGGSQAVRLVVQVVMARLLVPDDFGMLAVMLVLVDLGNTVAQSGLNTALVQDPNVTEEDYSTVFWMCLAAAAALYAVVFAGAPLVATFYGMPGLSAPLRALGLVLLVNAYNAVQISKITRELTMKKIFVGTVVSVLVSSALGIGAALAGLGVWALVLQQLGYQVSNVLAHAAQVDWRPRATFNAQRARALYAFGWKLLASGLLSTFYGSVTSLVAGWLFGSYQLGLISQGEKYPQALGTTIDGVIQPVMLSAVSRVQGDVAHARRIVRRALRTSAYLVMPAQCLAAAVAPTLVPLLLGEQWAPCVTYFQLFCLVFTMLPLHTTNLQALVGMGRSGTFLRLELVKTCLGAAGLLIAALVFGSPTALVASYVVTGLISTFVNACPSRRVFGYPYAQQLRDVAPTALLCATSWLGAWAVSLLPLGGAGLLLQVATFSALYLGLSFAFKLDEPAYLISVARELLDARWERGASHA